MNLIKKLFLTVVLLHGSFLHSMEKQNSSIETLFAMIRSGDQENANKLILSDKNLVHARDKHNLTPLHAASIGGYVSVVKTLISVGADVNASDENKENPLHDVAYWYSKDSYKVVQQLVGNGALINAGNDLGNTPLHIAAYNQKGLSILKELIKLKALINLKNKEGQTPLHLAANGNFIENVIALLVVGADHTIINKFGRTPLEEARWSKNRHIKSFHKHYKEVIKILELVTKKGLNKS